jgi:hypothetical protein
MVNGKAVNQPITEHWDGSKWTNVTTPSLTSVGGGSVYAINGSSASDIWIVGSEANGDMLSEHWDGSSWTLEKSPTVSANTSNWLSDVVDLAPNNVWAVGRVASGNNQFQPYVQHWDGTQWLTTQDPNPGAGELDAVTAVGSQVWIVGIPSTSGGHPFIETIC